jgi:hypothetical protein
MKTRFWFYALIFFAISLNTQAARWRMGPENIIDIKEWGTTEKIAIGDGANRTWFWNNAWGVTLFPNHNMPDDQSSKELRLAKSGSNCHWSLVFHFTKPISRFRFTTPQCSTIDLAGGDVYLQYTTNTDATSKELWRYSAKSPGYQKAGSIPPQQLPWVELSKPVETLTLDFVIDGFVGNMQFYDGIDDGGVLEYATLIPPIEQLTQIQLIPDGKDSANIYSLDEPLRAFIDVTPKQLAEPPVLVAADLGRNKSITIKTEPLGTGYLAELSTLPSGCYALTVHLQSDGKSVTVPGPRIVRVHPARVLTWNQTLHSPFGIFNVDSQPQLARLIGIHPLRGGSPTWITANPAKDVYELNFDPKTVILHDMQVGFVRSHSLAFTPGWARAQPNLGTYSPPTPEGMKNYAEYCRRLAKKTKGWYKPEFEIWNEPNNMPYGSFKGTFEEFVAICKTAADNVLAVNPKARMILGTTGGADVGFIERLFRAGLARQYKLVDIHPYRCTTQGPEDGLLCDINRLKKVIAKYGNNQGIIFSEIGWPTNPHYVGGNAMYEPVSFFQQACFFSRTMFISIAAGVERVHFHYITDWESKPDDPEGNFGVIDAKQQPKPVLCALSTTARHLEQAKFLGRAKTLPEYHHFWYWQTPWEKNAVLLTAWCDTVMVKEGKVQWISLPGKPILVEDLWGERPDESRLRKNKDRWEVLPGEDPIFIYLPRHLLPQNLVPLPPVMRPWHLRRLTATPLKNPIKIDGDLSDWKDLPGEITVNRSTGAGAMGFAGIQEKEKKAVTKDTSRFAVGYNDQGLYLAVRVRADKPMTNNDEYWWIWRGDCVRVYLGTVDPKEFPYMSENQFQFALAPVTKGNGPPQAVNIGYPTPRKVGMGDLIPGAKLAAKQLEQAWTLEAFIPWSYVGKSPAPSEIWSFDIEAGGLVWNGQQDNWLNPLHWGQLEF